MADFEAKAKDFQTAGIRLLAASVDSEEHARKTVHELKLSYPVACRLSAPEISALTGAFYDAEKNFVHATGFTLNPDCTVAGAVYSTGAIGRYTAADALDLVTALSNKK